MGMYRFSKTSLERRDGIDERLIRISDLAISICPIDFGIPLDGGLRTAERQQELHLAGKSRCDGYLHKSFHQTGKALDFYAFVHGKASWEVQHLTMVALAMMQAASSLEIPLRSGAFFKPFHDEPYNHGWDCGHVELMDVNP